MRRESFGIHVTSDEIADLQSRLHRTRFARASAVGWSGGTNGEYLAEFVDYWAERFDWRAFESAVNELPQELITIDDTDLHVLRLPGVRRDALSPAPLPLVLTHGWPSSFVEFLDLIPLLTDPASHGGDADDCFDVVVPSLPGFGLSADLPEGPFEPARIAQMWATLMTTGLGYKHFGAYGGDIGSHVTNFLGANHAEHVVGIYTHHPNLRPDIDSMVPLSDEERAYLESRATTLGHDGSYAAIQTNRPNTLAVGLSDSPAGLASWIIEKYREWGDCEGDLESVFSKDTLAQIVSLYWFTNTIGTSFRPYLDDARTPALPTVRVPTGITLTPEDAAYPREFAARTYADIRQWRGPRRGGHFLALEQPRSLAVDLRDFFRPLRAGAVPSVLPEQVSEESCALM